MTIDFAHPTHEAEGLKTKTGPTEAELLIREARLATRRRRFRVGVIVTIAIVVVAGTALLVIRGGNAANAGSRSAPAGNGASQSSSPLRPNLVGAQTILAQGTHAWVALQPFSAKPKNYAVTELNVVTGAQVQTIASRADEFLEPSVMALTSQFLWVVNDNSVSELKASNGALVRVISVKAPVGVSVSGGDAWIINGEKSNTVTEVNAQSGEIVRVLSGKSYGFNSPSSPVVAGTKAWFLNEQGNSITEVNTRSGAVVRIVNARAGNIGPQKYGTGASFASEEPIAMAENDGHLWVMDVHDPSSGGFGTGSLVEFNAQTGSFMKRVATAKDGFDFTWSMVSTGSHLWFSAANRTSNALVELNAANGSLARIIRDKTYAADSLKGNDALATDGSRLVVLDTGGKSQTVTVLNANTGALLRIIR